MDSIEAMVSKHEYQIEKLENEAEHNKTAHEKIYERLAKLEQGDATTAIQLNQIITMMAEMKADITTLKEKPAKRWETVIAAALSAVGGAGGMALISKLLGG